MTSIDRRSPRFPQNTARSSMFAVRDQQLVDAPTLQPAPHRSIKVLRVSSTLIAARTQLFEAGRTAQ